MIREQQIVRDGISLINYLMDDEYKIKQVVKLDTTGANRKKISMEECVFCKIINNEADCHLIFENDFVKVILDIEPVNVGHVLILPKIHKDSIDDIPLNYLFEIMTAAQKVVKAYKEIYKCDGYSIMQNGGSSCDFGHLHFHVFPRYNDDGFGWTYPSNAPLEYSADVANTIKEAFCSLDK